MIQASLYIIAVSLSLYYLESMILENLWTKVNFSRPHLDGE